MLFYSKELEYIVDYCPIPTKSNLNFIVESIMYRGMKRFIANCIIDQRKKSLLFGGPIGLIGIMLYLKTMMLNLIILFI